DGEANALVSPPQTADGPRAAPPVRGRPPVIFCRDENNWRKLGGRIREITIERDGSAWVRFEEGDRMPLNGGGGNFLPAERAKGVTNQSNLNPRPRGGGREARLRRVGG